MNKVEIKFKDKAIIKGNIILFSKDNTLEFIDACKVENVEILGVDGFLFIEDKIQPSQDDSIDLSRSSLQKGDAFIKAKEFVESKHESLYFEIICRD